MELITSTLTLLTNAMILAFCLVTLHTMASYLYLTQQLTVIQRRYHSQFDGYTTLQVFQTLLHGLAATKGMTMWLRKNGAADDTHLLHIPRPTTLLGYLLPRVNITQRKAPHGIQTQRT